MAQKIVMPAAAVTRLPGDVTHGGAARLAFLTWLGIAGEGVIQSGQRPGDVVAILGATGQMGGAAVLVALARGASRVIAVGRNEAALQRLAGLDARVSVVRLSGDIAEDMKAIVAIAPPHVVIDAAGNVENANAFLAGLGSLRDEGTIIMMGGTRCDVPIPYGDVLRRRLTIKGSRMYRSQTMAEIWRLVEAGLVDLSKVEVKTVGIDDPKAAIDLAARLSGLSIVSLVP